MMELLLMKTRHSSSLPMRYLQCLSRTYEFTCQSDTGGLPENIITLHVSGFQIFHSITCENAEEQLPENCEKSKHESTTHSGEGANVMGDFQNTPAHAKARLTMRVPGAPGVTGQLCCLITCWMQLYLQPKGIHAAKVSKNLNLMWITLQGPLSPGVLSNIRLISLNSWDQPSILWTGRPQKRVRFPSVLRHILTSPQRKCLVSAQGASTAVVPQLLKRYTKGTKPDFLVTVAQHSTWDCPM